MTREELGKVIEKIKKCLALAGSPNENEAKLAASKAAELMMTYNLTANEIKEGEEEYIKEEAAIGTDQGQDKYICWILEKYYFVDWCKSREWDEKKQGYVTTFFLVGKPHNVEIAKFVYTFLARQFHVLWRAYRKDNPGSQRAAYYSGLRRGVEEQLEATKKKVESTTGLMVVKDAALHKWMNEELNIKTTSSSFTITDGKAMAAGKEAGKNIRIQRGMGEGRPGGNWSKNKYYLNK